MGVFQFKLTNIRFRTVQNPHKFQHSLAHSNPAFANYAKSNLKHAIKWQFFCEKYLIVRTVFMHTVRMEGDIMAKTNKNRKQPLLSISLLTSVRKDCIRRCLDSLAPIREQIDCELIIVDTGCDAEMLEILREYTEQIIPFTWCDDFSAARNAGLKQAKGKWFLFIDDDEWFGDATELIDFFQSGEYARYDAARYLVRNFRDSKRDSYLDTGALRVIRKDRATAFVGIVHEVLMPIGKRIKILHSFAYHDGYAYQSAEERSKHALRNIRLLNKALKKEPNNLHNRSQLFLEYASNQEWRKTYELCKETLALIEKIDNAYINKMRGEFYAGSVEACMQSMQLEEGVEEGKNALADTRNMPMAQAALHIDMAKLYYKLGDDQNCKDSCYQYLQYYEKLHENEQDRISQSIGAYIVEHACEERNKNFICDFLVRISLKENDIETAKTYFEKMGWEQEDEQAYPNGHSKTESGGYKNEAYPNGHPRIKSNNKVYVYDDKLIPQMIETMADTDFHPWYVSVAQTFMNRKEFSAGVIKTLQSIEKAVDEDREGSIRFARLARIFSQVQAEHFYIDYLKIHHAAFTHETEGVEEAYDAIFRKVVNPFNLNRSIWRIAEDLHLDLERHFLNIPFRRWRMGVDAFCMRTTLEKIREYAELLARIQSRQDIRYDYFTVKSLEARLKYAEAGDDYEKLHALFDRFSDETVALYARYFKEESFQGEMDMLPDPCKAAVRIQTALEAEAAGDYRTALGTLKECAGVCVSLDEAIKVYANLCAERFKNKANQSAGQKNVVENQDRMPKDNPPKYNAHPNNEMELLATGVKAKAKELIGAGMCKEAAQALEQLLVYVPNDKETKELLTASGRAY